MKFTDLPLTVPIQSALRDAGYDEPTPIQQQAIPIILNQHDLLGIAQTGTGKTAAFCLPMLQILSKSAWKVEPKRPRALILTPTRELAIQIHKNLQVYGKHLKLKHSVIFGGVGQGLQVRDLAAGIDILVATPGRLLDLIQQKHLRLDRVEMFVLDEADRMLDMGFLPDVKRVLPLLPVKRHNLFFSATMPNEIQKLANSILHEPKKVEVTPQATTAERIDQSLLFVEKKDKPSLLLHLLQDNNLFKVLVFVQMKHAADKVVDKLQKNGVTAAAIHGNKSQNNRQRAIEDFENNKIRVLVATDIASRGIDIDGITHVINYELPHLPETYVHRIGRTARAGAEGQAISFCTAEEKSYLFAIEKTTRTEVNVIQDHPFHSHQAATARIVSVGRAKASIEGGKHKGGGKGGAQKFESKEEYFKNKKRFGNKKRRFGKPGASGGGKPSFGKPSAGSGGKPSSSGGKPSFGKPKHKN